MLESVCNVFQRHTFLDGLRAGREHYTVEMYVGVERIPSNINLVQHLGPVLKSRNVDLESNKRAMAILNWLSRHYDSIITALDALGDERALFTPENVRSRPVHDEQRQNMKGPVEKIETASLRSNSYATGGDLHASTANTRVIPENAAGPGTRQ